MLLRYNDEYSSWLPLRNVQTDAQRGSSGMNCLKAHNVDNAGDQYQSLDVDQLHPLPIR